jgi:hypothetical protein
MSGMEDVFVVEIDSAPRIGPIVATVIGLVAGAFCIWLTVRLVNRRKKRSATFWVTLLVLAVLVGYPLSFGPAFWLYSRLMTTPIGHFANRFYHPIILTWRSGPEWIAGPIGWYANAGAYFKLYPAQSFGGDVFVGRSTY